jgi:DNA-binding PadR family transcriptional regulator
MATKKRPSNLLALSVLSLLTEHAMHPYEMSVLMRHRGHAEHIKSSHGSIYTIVEALERDGLVESQAPSREGKRPERTVYAITSAGTELLHEWLSEILAHPAKEYPEFIAGLMLVAHIPKAEIIGILHERVGELEERLTADRYSRSQFANAIPRVFMIEVEYEDAMRTAEIKWLRKTIDEIQSGAYPWPLIVDSQLTWPDGNETFTVPDMPLEAWEAQAKSMGRGTAAGSTSTKPDRTEGEEASEK